MLWCAASIADSVTSSHFSAVASGSRSCSSTSTGRMRASTTTGQCQSRSTHILSSSRVRAFSTPEIGPVYRWSLTCGTRLVARLGLGTIGISSGAPTLATLSIAA